MIRSWRCNGGAREGLLLAVPVLFFLGVQSPSLEARGSETNTKVAVKYLQFLPVRDPGCQLPRVGVGYLDHCCAASHNAQHVVCAQ